MDLPKLWLLVVTFCVAWSARSAMGLESKGDEEEVLEDLPLDSKDPEGLVSNHRDDIEDVGFGEEDDELNGLEDIDLSEVEQTESSRQQLLRKVLSAAMAKPGARQRLAQVMPIIRTMSATQRLALAGLVSSQLMAPEGAPPPIPSMANSSNANISNDLMIPISMDIASMFRGLGRNAAAARSNLFRGDLYKRHPPYRRKPIQNHNRRNTEVPSDDMKPPPPPPRFKPPKLRPGLNKLHVDRFPPPGGLTSDDQAGVDCEYFTNSLCLHIRDYPMEAILKSIQSTQNKNAFEALRADANQDFSDIFPPELTIDRRQGESSRESQSSYMCSSKVEVARPKRARATSGQWKYVVNTGDYTQTLRLEMCLKPQQSCSYLADNIKSQCTQVYNYHRLLTWDHKSGLTMDIFKVPTCCSCHVQPPTYPFLQPQTSESVRLPVQPIEPVRHATSPPRMNYVEAPETNYVAEEPPVAIRQPPKQILNRRPPGGLHNIPKRESHPPPRLEEPLRYSHPQYENLLRRTNARNQSENDIRPQYLPVQPTLNQRHPELPADNILSDNTYSLVTSEPDYQSPPRVYKRPSRLPPTTLPPRRSTLASTPKRVVTYQSQTTTQQSPSMTTKVSPQSLTTQQTPSSKRVNYSYHPIIDFFKTGVSAGDVIEDRLSNAEWTPITEGPHLIPK